MQVGRTPHVPASTIRRTGLSRWGTRIVAAIACLVTGQVASAQTALGIITGTVTDVATGSPVSAARVLVAGTTNGTLTGDDGKYTLRQVTPGLVTIEFNRIGYEMKKATVTAAAGAPVTLNVTLKAAVFSLQAVVTTVTGPQRKIELANTTSTIDVSKKIAEAPVNSMGTLLSGRAAGVQVVSSGATGAGSRIRIRGQSSLSLNNDPLVYIDGIRMASSSTYGKNATNSSPSRFDDLNPAEIETIEVLKGPSASALYGTEAANGVINITTKKGRTGKTVWNVYSENGLINDPHKFSYPHQYYAYGTLGTQAGGPCSLTALQDPRPATHCAKQDSLVNYSLLSNPLTTPLTQGTRQEYGIQVSGGSDKLQFFVAGDKQDETGVYKMPGEEIARLKAERGVSALPTEQVRPNALDRVNLRTNLTAQLTSRARIQLSSAFINSDQRQSDNENSSTSLMVAYLGGNLALNPKTGQQKTDSRGVPLHGEYSYPVGDIMSVPITQNVNRFINSLAANWQTTDWLSAKSTVGLDYTSLNARTTQLNGQGIIGSTRVGDIDNSKIILANYSADAGATASWNPFGWLGTKTSVGLQYYKIDNDNVTGHGNDLPPGAQSITAAATRTGTSATTETITFGTYAEEVLSLRDHVFITGGVRLDNNSAFGAKFTGAKYPHAGVSWALSDEPFFPKFNWLQQFRVRGSYGASGQAPGNIDALRYYSALTQTLPGGTTSGVRLAALGNPNLKPEYSSEGEGGFDLNMFDGGTNLELTYYSKATRDALIFRDIAPSLDGIKSQWSNIGRVKNAGVEFTLNQRIIDTRLAALTLNFNGSTTRNKLVTLGTGVSPIPTGDRNTQLNTTGYPLFGMWGRTYTYNDANHDGILSPGFPATATTAAVPSEITYSDAPQFIGTTYPKFEMAFSPNLELFDHKLRFNAQFDHKAGITKFNDTHRHECTSVKSCQGWFDPNASLADQAATLAANSSNGILTGFFENADFTRFRELSAAYQMPDKLAHYLRAERWNLVLTGRNLHVWTKYKGVDPEATVGNGDSHGNEEYFSTPPLRYFTFRMNFTF
jgi:TonB-linked SusC/RagA family outer membrane protein